MKQEEKEGQSHASLEMGAVSREIIYCMPVRRLGTWQRRAVVEDIWDKMKGTKQLCTFFTGEALLCFFVPTTIKRTSLYEPLGFII
jgi:hypothetical protein